MNLLLNGAEVLLTKETEKTKVPNVLFASVFPGNIDL